MRNLSNVINDYLSKPSDYAIQLVGAWGVGKTHNYRQVLEPQIEETPVHSDNCKKYKPVYVSLFGLHSIEEIATRIVLQFYEQKYFKKYVKSPTARKRLRVTAGVLKIGWQGFLKLQGLGGEGDYAASIKNIGQQVLDTQELVICFDDLERKAVGLALEDVIGYINSLVDEGVKVMIIANEDLLLKDRSTYSHLKEKIIGITISYAPAIQDTLQSIIDHRYAGFPSYRDLLLKDLSVLQIFVRQIECNFRHVIYALDVWHHCYARIKTDILDVRHEISHKVEEQLPILIKMTLAFAAEYKHSRVQYADIDNYRSSAISLTLLIARAASKDKEKETDSKTPIELLMDRYSIPPSRYFFSSTIFSYITGAGEWETPAFIAEFIHHFKLDKGLVLPQYELLNTLEQPAFYYLSDKQYRSMTLDLLQYAEQGDFSLPDYFTVLEYVERLDNMMELDLDQVMERLIQGMKKSLGHEHVNHENALEKFRATERYRPLSGRNSKLYEAGLQQISAFYQRIDQRKVDILLHHLVQEPDLFREKYIQDVHFKEMVHQTPFLHKVEADQLGTLLTTVSQEMLYFLQMFLHNRFQRVEWFKQEGSFISRCNDDLASHLAAVPAKNRKTLRYHLLQQLLDTVETIHSGLVVPNRKMELNATASIVQ